MATKLFGTHIVSNHFYKLLTNCLFDSGNILNLKTEIRFIYEVVYIDWTQTV